jgi:hypothetical protein
MKNGTRMNADCDRRLSALIFAASAYPDAARVKNCRSPAA